MKDAFTLGELVAMGLPGYPSTRQGWRLMVEKRGWKVVRLDVPGGRKNLYCPPLQTMQVINATQFKKTVQELYGGAFSAEYVEAARGRRAAERQASAQRHLKEKEASYESPSFEKEEDADVLALDLLKWLDGMPVVLIRLVLRQAEFWLDATTTLDCSANEFQKAYAEFQRVAGKSL